MIRARPGAAWPALLVLMAACQAGPERSGDPALDADVAVSPTPASTTGTRVQVSVTDAGQPATDVQVVLRTEGQAGEGPVDTLVHRGQGLHASAALHFPSAGEWMLVVEVRSPSGREARFRRPVTVSGPPGG